MVAEQVEVQSLDSDRSRCRVLMDPNATYLTLDEKGWISDEAEMMGGLEGSCLLTHTSYIRSSEAENPNRGTTQTLDIHYRSTRAKLDH